jgi:ribonuclease HI
MKWATVISDASYSQSPKGDISAGWAVWIKCDGLDRALKAFGAVKKGSITNNTEAEIVAALNGVWLAKTHLLATGCHIRADNLTVVKLIKGEVTAGKSFEFWQQALETAGLQDIALVARHVKAHVPSNGDRASYVNKWCDDFAGRARRFNAPFTIKGHPYADHR